MITRVYLVNPFTIEETQTKVTYMDFDSSIECDAEGIASDGIFIPYTNIAIMFTTKEEDNEVKEEDSISERSTG